MSAFPKVKQKWTVEEYLAFEEKSDQKHEFFDGEIFDMAGASERHALILASTSALLYMQVRNRPCKVYSNDLRVRVNQARHYTYPDIIVVCGEAQIERVRGDTLLNPTVIIEVLSPSTENYDRTQKFQSYRTLESLQEYVLISQDSIHIEHYTRDIDHWRVVDLTQPEDVLTLTSIDCTLSVSEIYEKVTFDDNA
jgi:Uma2 family endonuclease